MKLALEPMSACPAWIDSKFLIVASIVAWSSVPTDGIEFLINWIIIPAKLSIWVYAASIWCTALLSSSSVLGEDGSFVIDSLRV